MDFLFIKLNIGSFYCRNFNIVVVDFLEISIVDIYKFICIMFSNY